MLKKFTKILVLSGIFYSALNTQLSASSTDIVQLYSGGSALSLHPAHTSRLYALRKISDDNPKEWHSGLIDSGYLKSNSATASISVAFYTNYGTLRGKDTQTEASTCSWAACDESFDKSIIENVKYYVERTGRSSLTSKQIDHIKSDLNPGRGTRRGVGTSNRFSITTLDTNRIGKFHLKITTNYDVSSEWTCYRYTARMSAELDMGIYDFLGK